MYSPNVFTSDVNKYVTGQMLDLKDSTHADMVDKATYARRPFSGLPANCLTKTLDSNKPKIKGCPYTGGVTPMMCKGACGRQWREWLAPFLSNWCMEHNDRGCRIELVALKNIPEEKENGMHNVAAMFLVSNQEELLLYNMNTTTGEETKLYTGNKIESDVEDLTAKIQKYLYPSIDEVLSENRTLYLLMPTYTDELSPYLPSYNVFEKSAYLLSELIYVDVQDIDE